MANSYHYIDVSKENVLERAPNDIWKSLVRKTIDLYDYKKKKYKITAGYSVHTNNKGKLSVNLSMPEQYMQIRIQNQENLLDLGEYSENVRNQILNANPCKACPNNEGIFNGHNENIFTYQGKEYRKCKSWESNFRFYNITNNDIDSLIKIVEREFNFTKANK